MSKFIDVLIYAILVSSALILAIILFRLVHGNFLNSYPYISPDGFDWLYEGAYLKAVLTGWPTAELPVPFFLRQPIFVFVTAMDAATGSRGTIIILCMAISFFLTGFTINQILLRLGISSLIRLWGVIAFIMSPLNFYAYWVLSDQLAIMLMMISTYMLMTSRFGLDRRRYLTATVIAVLAGLTQLYGLIPFSVGTTLYFIHRRQEYKQWAFDLVAISAIAAIIWFLSLYTWFAIIPHEFYPSQLANLELSLKMVDFYANTWIIGFGPLLLVCIYAILNINNRIKIFHDIDRLWMLLVVIVFSALVFVYQWPEARFSYLYQGFVIILTCILLQNSLRTSSVASFVSVGVALAALCAIVAEVLVVPDSYWQPHFGQMRVDFQRSWLGTPITGSAYDRFRLEAACSSRVNFCTAADATASVSVFGFYVLRVTADYRKLMLLLNDQASRKPRS